MDAVAFYRRSTLLPVALPVLGTLLLPLHNRWPGNDVLSALTALSVTSLFAGVYATVPYGLYLGIVWKYFRPTNEASHRRAAFVAPLVLAVAFASYATIAEQLENPLPWREIATAFSFYAALALGCGYVYVLLIEFALAVGKSFGWITPVLRSDASVAP